MCGTALPASIETLTSAYDATWATIAEEPIVEPQPTDDNTNEATAVIAHVRTLSPFLRRHIARALVTADDTLMTSVIDEARVRYQQSEEQRHELEQMQHALTHDNRQLRAQLQTVTDRLATVGPVEQLAGTPEVATILQAVMEVVAAAGPPLITQAIRLLDTRTRREATTALTRTLQLVAARVQACQRCLADDYTTTSSTSTLPSLPQEDSV